MQDDANWVLACRTGVIFFAFSVEHRQARGEREVRVTRDGKTERARKVIFLWFPTPARDSHFALASDTQSKISFRFSQSNYLKHYFYWWTNLEIDVMPRKLFFSFHLEKYYFPIECTFWFHLEIRLVPRKNFVKNDSITVYIAILSLCKLTFYVIHSM